MNKKNPLVSIMMPVYNGGASIIKSIKSLLLQTYTNWECIIVNDGSTDGTKDYINSLTDDRFIVHHFKENKGRPYARQKALNLSKGKYLAMLDADDWYFPDKLEKQVDFLENNNNIILLSNAMMLTNKKGELLSINGVKKKIKHKGYVEVINHGSSMIRMDNAKNHKYNLELSLGQDLDYIRRLLGDSHYFVSLPESNYVYNVGDSFSLKKYINSMLLKMKNQQIYLIPLIKIIIITFLSIFRMYDFIVKMRGSPYNKKDLEKYKELKVELCME